MRQKGFTLIELMIVVMVIAILAAIAVPSYLEQSRKGRRADAVRAVGDLQLALERWRAENPSYANCGADCTSGTYPSIPTSPYYGIAISNETASTYTITATRSSGPQANDRCGNLVAAFDPVTGKPGKPTWSGDSDCNN